MKILYVTTVGSTMGFFRSFVRMLLDEGNTVDIATNNSAEGDIGVQQCYFDWGCRIYPISTSRSAFSSGNVKAISQIRKLVTDNQYDIVHCHTPLAAAATRIACKGLRKKGVKVIYTAHGFHFYKGAPKKNWLIYYPIEKLCSRWTDVLITINKEDYELAKSKMRAKRTEYVPGVGINIKKFSDVTVEKNGKKESIGVPEGAKIILSVGELNENKNHRVVIEALGKLNDSSVHYVIAGEGDQRTALEQLAKELNVNLHLLGFRSDVAELYKIADLYALPSIREGLNVSVMEALASGLPCCVSQIRGNVDMIDSTVGGLCDPFDADSWRKGITESFGRRSDIIESMQDSCRAKSTLFDYLRINAIMKEVYDSVRS